MSPTMMSSEQTASIERRLGETAWRNLGRRSPRARLFALAGTETIAELAEKVQASKSGLHKVLQLAERQRWLSEDWAERLAKVCEDERRLAAGGHVDSAAAVTPLDIFVLFGCDRQASQLIGQLALPIDAAATEMPAA